MMKVLLILLPLLFLSGCSKGFSQVTINNQAFNIELASNPLTRAKGLMFRKSLDENSGMLFLFPKEKKYSFWMKNTYIPLDLIWISEKKEIVFIKQNAQPGSGSIKPDKEAFYVLEINANLTQKYNIKVGDRVKIK